MGIVRNFATIIEKPKLNLTDMKKKAFLTVVLSLLSLVSFADNQALQLNSSSSAYVEVPFFATPADMTIEAWIKTTQTSTGTIVAWKDVASDGESSMFRVYGGKLQYGEWFYGTSWKEILSAENVNTGAWTHVAVVRSGSAASICVNGQLSAEATMHSSASCTTDNLKIGALGTVWSECFNGSIDEVRIWSVARTAEEIAANYQKELSGTESGLEGYWKFDGDATDSSVNGRNGSEKSVSYVASDIFATEKPSITALTYTESTTTLPQIAASVNRSGNLYWVIAAAEATAPTSAEILAGKGTSIALSGNFAAGKSGEVTYPLTTHAQLTQGTAYTPYAVLEASDGSRSDVFTGEKFNYVGLSCMPEGWWYTDLGTTDEAGHSVGTGDTFTVKGGGSDIWNASDSFHYAYTAAADDVEIVAHVSEFSTSDEWAKAGIMLRNALQDNAPHVFICTTNGQGNNQFIRRKTSGTTSVSTRSEAVSWLKLIKKDQWVATYVSADGENWEQVGSAVELLTLQMPYVGFAVCGHGSGMATAVFDNVKVTTPAADLSLSDRGIYFDKKKYVTTRIPSYDVNKNKLPRPVLSDNPEWVNMYYKAWQIGFSHIKQPTAGSPLVSNFYDENFDGNIFQWDMLFMTIFGRYAEHIFPGIESLDNFYCRQHVSGCITRCVDETTGADNGDEDSDNIINPPLFSWAELLDYRFTADTLRLRRVLPVLEKYAEFVELKRRCSDTPHDLYWNNGQASGMDNLPRDIGRANLHHASDHQGWIDMSSQMIIQYRSMAEMCRVLANAEKDEAQSKTYASKAVRYDAEADGICERMNKWLWNEKDGIYYDCDTLGVQNKWKTIAAFWPMLAGVTTAEQDSALVKHLRDTNSFWRDNVFPALAADQEYYSPRGGYWCGGVWAPSNYAVIKGLENKNIDWLAYLASMRYIGAVYDVYKQTGTFWENYAPEKTSEGLYNHGTDESDYDPCRSDFIGWTGLAPISLLIENVLGFRVDGPNNVVDYDLRRLDKHGIQKLCFTGITTTILTEKREDSNSAVSIKVTTDKPYTLRVHRDKKVDTINVPAGTNTFNLEALTTGIVSAKSRVQNATVDYDSHAQRISIAAGEEAFTANLYNLACTKVLHQASDGSAACTISTEGLPTGVYVLDVESENGHYSRKITLK